MATRVEAMAVRARPGLRPVAWLLIAATVIVVLLSPRFLPFYDYLEWLLQGQIMHDLWVGASVDGEPIAQLYALRPVPVPNLAAPAGIALLTFVFPVEVAGRILLVLGVLGFAAGYAFLVRRWQGQASALEFTGVVWAFGYFLQRGYVSYLFALPVAFVGIGIMHRDGARLVRLTALQVLAFLGHLVAWGVLAGATACYAVALYRDGRRAAAFRLAATAAPSALLLVWYTIATPEAGHLVWYGSLRDKGLALAETLQLFLRLDPYPGVVPTLAAELLATAALAVVVAVNVRWRALRWTPQMLAALALATVAVLDPVGNVNSLTKPDQRLLFPAVLLLLAALPWRQPRPRATAVAAAVVLATLALHGVAWSSTNAPLQRAFAAITAAVPAKAAVTTLALPADGGCAPGPPSIGIPALKWFDVARMLSVGARRATLQETSAVVRRPDLNPGLTASTPAAAAATATTPIVEIFGCAADVTTAVRALDPHYTMTVSGDGYAVLHART
jgi:hypothetical protein